MRGHTLRVSTAPPAGEIYSPTLSYDASSSSTKATLRSEQRAAKSGSGRGRVFRLQEAERLPAGLGPKSLPASVHDVRTPRQAASQHRRDTKHRPHSAKLPKPEYTPRPVEMSTQNQHLLLQHRHPNFSCTWSSMIPPISLLLMSGYSHMRPSRAKILTRLVSVPKPASLAETSLATMKSRFFF